MKKITLSILLVLLSMLSFGQSVSVTVTELKVLNLSATSINFGTNVTSVNVSITATASTSYTNNSQGSIAVYYKRNSSTATTPIIPTNGYDGNFYFPNGLSGTKTFKITLNRSEFDDNGGFIYIEYRPNVSNLLAYKSSNINVTKILDLISNNIISGNQTVYEGQSASAISGSTPSGGNGTFTYSWQQKVGNGTWTSVSGATGINYSPGILAATTSFKRSVTSAGLTNTSAEITVTVAPVLPLQNNTIYLDNLAVLATDPTGGLGINSYQYSWFIIDKNGDKRQLPDSSPYLMLTTPQFAPYLSSVDNFTILRIVTSGSKFVASNTIPIPHISAIQNNIISISNKTAIGSIPTGGIGNYTYSWAIYYTGDAIDFDETTKDLDLTPYLIGINDILQTDPTAKLVRIATAGISSKSNLLSLNSFTAKAVALSEESTVNNAVYPNPTSGSVNFSTSSSSNQEMEIIVYSEGLRNPQSVFKGTTKPNQTIKWDIPSNYSKGIYYYKIISDNKEIKSGKILFQ